MFKIEQHLEPLEQAPATSIAKKCGNFFGILLAGSLESQLGIEIQSLQNTEHCQVGQMSVGLDSVALYRFELPQK